MLNAVLQHTNGLLNGLTIPYQSIPLESWIQPPPSESAAGPKAYIVAATGGWKRQSMPRGQGFQEFNWPLEIYLKLQTSTQVPNIDQIMPTFVDAVLWALLTATMPVMITDPTTNRESQYWSVAESGSLQVPPGRTQTSMSLLQFDAGLSVTVKEVIQA